MSHVIRESTGRKNPRVLIIVNGGVAEYVADSEADVYMIDFDNEPNATVPDKFIDLLK